MSLPTVEETRQELARIAREFEPGTVLRLPGMVTRDEYEHMLAIRRAQRVRIRNDGRLTGELFGCKRHGSPSRIPGIHIKPVIHPFISSYCVPIPFHGLLDGLHYLVSVTDNPDARERLGSMVMRGLPSLDDIFPEMADTIRPQTPGEDVYSFCIGTAEPISTAQAEKDEAEITRLGRRPILRREPVWRR